MSGTKTERKFQIILRYILEFSLGDNIIISYTTKNGTRYIYYINDNWLIVISFILSTFILFLIKLMWKKTRNISNPRGGSFLEECLNPDKTYEVIDEDLKRIIRSLVTNPSLKSLLKETFGSKGPLVVTPFLFFVAAVTKSNPVAQASILGLDVLINNIKRGTIKVSGGAFVAVVVMGFIKTFLAKVIFLLFSSSGVLLLGLIIRHVACNCNQLLQELPQLPIPIETTLVSSNKPKYFLDVPKNKLEQIILVKDFEYSEESNIYSLEKVMDETCSVQMDKLNRISRTCESEKIYIPLTEIRLSDIDIVRWDSSEIRKTASVAQKNYELRKNKPEKLREAAESEEQQKTLLANSEASQSVVEDFIKPSTTGSTPAAESMLFRNPNCLKKIPLSQRTNTWLNMVQKTLEEANLSLYKDISDPDILDVFESEVKPTERIREEVAKPKVNLKEELNPNSEEL
jgi:hypothetical protein